MTVGGPKPRRVAVGRIAFGLSLAVAAVVYHASLRTPVEPSSGTLMVVAAPPFVASSPLRLRLGTYNIHGGKGLDGRLDLPRIAEVVRGCDFVGLNETFGPGLGETDDQATALARRLGLTPLFAPAEQRWYHLRFGNAFVTRVPVNAWRVVPLERRWARSYRNFVHVELRPSPAPPTIHVLVAHVDRSDDRERHDQLRTLTEFFAALPSPAVLMGDLNSDADDAEVRKLLAAPGVVDAVAAKLGPAAPRHIDWILVRGLKVVDAGLTETGPSDHPHVWAEVEFASAID